MLAIIDLAQATLIAIAIGSLATAAMAIYTKRLAKGAQAEVAAQWTPVLLAVQAPRNRKDRTLGDENNSPRWDGRDFVLTVRNVGRGPALDVYAVIGQNVLTGYTTIPHGESAELRFKQLPGDLIDSELPVTVSIHYHNLNTDALSSYAIIQTLTTFNDYWVAFTTYNGDATMMDTLTRAQRLWRHMPDFARRPFKRWRDTPFVPPPTDHP